ncbi:MAG: TPM domain-containing protein [Ignavibacteriaceae bacterium]
METPYIYNFLNDDEMLRISNKIKEHEKNTSGEICVSIKEGKTFNEKKKDLKQLAEEEFFRRNIDKTKDKTGILIFILLKEKKFYILADSGINEKVSPETWDSIKDKMQVMFSDGKFAKGIIYSIEEVGIILARHFPIKAGDINELSNKINF